MVWTIEGQGMGKTDTLLYLIILIKQNTPLAEKEVIAWGTQQDVR